jgi:hypothetical protein
MRNKLILLVCGLALAVIAAVWLKSGRRPMREGYDPNQNNFPADARKVLETGEHFVLLSLDPTHPALRSESAPPPKETFHDYSVLGKTEIRSAEERTELLRALDKGIADSDGSVASCFNPRHGISATLHGETVDLIICFECLSIETYTTHRDGVLNRSKNVFTTRSPQPTFNRALERARLPVAKKK